MSFATLHRWKLLLVIVATTMLTGCAWAPGALCLNPFIHHRNYRAAKAAWLTYGRGDLGPWAPLCKDFEAGWREGYYDVADGKDGQRPITPPRRYWAARYQSPAGERQVEAWFAGYELGAAAAQRDGIGYWAFVPTSLGVPAQERIEEHGSMGYRIMPDAQRNDALDDRDVPRAEPVIPVEPELVRPQPAAPRELPLPAEEPRQLPERSTEPAPPAAEPEPADLPDAEAPAVEPESAPTEEAPAEPTTPREAGPSDDPFADPFATPPAEESPDVPSLDEETPADQPAPDRQDSEPPLEADPIEAEAPAAEPTRPGEIEPADPGAGVPVIPRREPNFPPRPSTPRQPGQQAPPEGELPKGLDTDDPLPDLGEGAAVMRRPRPVRPSSVKTLSARAGSNRLRLAPAATPSPSAIAAGGSPLTSLPARAASVDRASDVTVVAAEEPTQWGPKVQPAVHMESDSESSSSPAASDAEADAEAVVDGLRMFSAHAGRSEVPGDALSREQTSDTSVEPLGDDDLFSGLSTLAEGDTSRSE
jgi:hypothetical protein